MKWDISDIHHWKAEQHELGGTILESGNARYYQTGGWRTNRPIWDPQKCTQCLFCYFFCPDSSVIVTDQKVSDFDYDHCKGCGICATECPADAIVMKLESDCRAEEEA